MKFTPTQERILKVLSDGRIHTKDELFNCLDDELADRNGSAVKRHLSIMRKQLRPNGQDIICEFFQRKRFYRHVRLIGRGE
ncbi:hypothetical protein OAG36_00530 [bacterium]|nr:hypothetical protein [bacterium]